MSDERVDFVRDVRPILSQHCFACHGPDEHGRQAKLSLVDFESATAPRRGHPAITPGDLDASSVWARITDADFPMPPAEAHNPLSAKQIDVLRRWIEQGASYAPHWAYVTPAHVDPPPVTDDEWPHDDVDRYILARLEREGLGPAPDADATTLLRRVTYDVLGLPPKTDEIDAFLADESDDAYERAVDRLLASPHFGERMAVIWLDLVRYADSVGYHGDQTHNIWPYRNYVIDAFNDDMPFDRFTIEQLAGDLLPTPTQEQLVASAYNRLLQTSHEGGVQLEEYRAIYQADRIRNASMTWMGGTLGCAQCHDHKYDPYTAEDFYAFGAFFADIDDEEHLRNQYSGLNTLPTRRTPEMRVLSDDARRQLDEFDERLATLDTAIADATAALPAERERWETALRDAIEAGVQTEVTWIDDQLDTGGQTSGTWDFTDEVTPHSGSFSRRQKSGGLVQHYTVDTTRTIRVAEGDTLFAWIRLDPEDPPTAVMLQFNIAGDWNYRGVWGNDDISYGRRLADWRGYRRFGPLPRVNDWVRLEVPIKNIGLEPGQVISGMAFTQFGGTAYWDLCGVRTNQAAPVAVADALAVAADERTDEQLATIAAHHATTAPVLIELRDEREDVAAERAAVETAQPLIMYTRALHEPREVRILPRGNWLDTSGPVVQPAVPRFLGELAVDGRATRLDLARWLVTSHTQGGTGEMTARVFVNRIWAMLFGAGLCPTLDDFGGQGQPPNHLELLDHLALDFVESGWDVKALVRRLVMTRTYRQSSIPSADAARLDPNNHLFARQTRARFPAEMVRDTALSVSGLLVDTIGGPSVRPPQPAGLYRHLNFPQRKYEADMGEAIWRRGVYVHWQRQYLHPMMLAFDAPTREECTAERVISNTPLAALTLLNDPSFVEAARAFSLRIRNEADGDDRTRIAWAMREATGRRPHDLEVDILHALLEADRAHYTANADETAAFVTAGDVEHAAWTQVARAILNLHETITRE